MRVCRFLLGLEDKMLLVLVQVVERPRRASGLGTGNRPHLGRPHLGLRMSGSPRGGAAELQSSPSTLHGVAMMNERALRDFLRFSVRSSPQR